MVAASVCGTRVNPRQPTCVKHHDAKNVTCAAYLLGEGVPFAVPHELAAQRSTSTIEFVPLNAAIVAGMQHVFVRLAPANVSSARRAQFRYRKEGVAWIHCSPDSQWHVEAGWAPAQDPRPIWHRGSLLVFFSQPETITKVDYGSIHPSNSRIHFVMRNLTKGHAGSGGGSSSSRRSLARASRSIKLTPPVRWCSSCGPTWRRPWEKNWTPFITPAGELLLSYSLEPHVLLRCDFGNTFGEAAATGAGSLPGGAINLASGRCSAAHYSSSPKAWLAGAGTRSNSTTAKGPRGSSPMIRVRGRYISCAHFHGRWDIYWHVFYEVDPSPPHAVVRTSPPFRFNFTGTGAAYQRVQFVTSMVLSADASSIIIAYGVCDTGSRLAALRVEDVLRMLERDAFPEAMPEETTGAERSWDDATQIAQSSR